MLILIWIILSQKRYSVSSQYCTMVIFNLRTTKRWALKNLLSAAAFYLRINYNWKIFSLKAKISVKCIKSPKYRNSKWLREPEIFRLYIVVFNNCQIIMHILFLTENLKLSSFHELSFLSFFTNVTIILDNLMNF